MSHSDEDYPDLDVSTDVNENAASSGCGEVVGAPPSSDVESDDDAYHTPTSEENQIYQYEENQFDLYDSGSDDFDVEGYEQEQMADLHIHDMSSYVDIGNEQEANPARNFQEFEDSTKEILQVLLPSAMIANIEHMTTGFEPPVINESLKDVGYCLEVVSMILLGGEKFETLPKAPVDWCHALKDAGHLEFFNGKFYPRVPESLREHCASLIEGANRLSAFEANKKREQETYKSEEFEIRVLHTFNMIAELLHAVRDDQRQLKINYSHLASAFEMMVKGIKHHDLFKKYKGILSLNDPKKLWNSPWFNEYTGRSSLQKFIHMARFSEIAVTNTNPTMFYFRADDDVNPREVILFQKKDFEEVRQKWKTGNQGNRNFGRNYGGGGGQRAGGRGPSQQHAKKTIEQDPNYRPARLNGVMDSADDGSLEPSTSCWNNREKSPPRPIRNRSPGQSRGPSPIRARSPSPFGGARTSQVPQQERPSSPESQQSDPPPRAALPDPFGGRPVQRSEETNRGAGPSDNQQLSRDNYGRNRAGEVKRIENQMIGETSSEGELTSDGSYSNEDEDAKIAKRERRLAVKKKKDEREMRRRKQHEENRNKPVGTTRFSVSQFKKKSPQNVLRSPERRRQESPPPEVPVADQSTTSTEPFPPVEEPVEEPAPVQTNTADSDEEEELPVRPQATNRAPAVVTDTASNPLSHQAQVPYRPSPLDAQKKRMEQEEKAKKASMNAVKRYGADAVLPHHPALLSQTPGAGPAPPPIQSPQAYLEPEPPSGFGNSQSYDQIGTSQQDDRPPVFNENYQGRNQQRHSEPIHHHPQQQQQQQPLQRQPPPPQQHYQPSQNQQQYYPQPAPVQQHQQPQWEQHHQQQRPLSRGSSHHSDRQMNNHEQDNRHNGNQNYNYGQQIRSRNDYPEQNRQMNNNSGHRADNTQYDHYPQSSSHNYNQMNQQQVASYQGNPSQYQQPPQHQNSPYNPWHATAPSRNRSQQYSSGENYQNYNQQGYSNNQGNHRSDRDRRPHRDDDSVSCFHESRRHQPAPSHQDPRNQIIVNVLKMMEAVERNGFIVVNQLEREVDMNQHLFPPGFDVYRFVNNVMSDRVRIVMNHGVEVFTRDY